MQARMGVVVMKALHTRNNPHLSVSVIIMMAALLMNFLSSTALADEGKRVALVVGINKYKEFGKDRQLKRAVNDARGVARTLQKIGFQVTEGVDVTTDQFDSKWHDVRTSLTEQDTFVLFFSGHGVEIDGENFLLPSDIPFFEFGRHRKFQRRAISVQQLLSDLRTGDRRQPQVTIIILDACREDPTIPEELRSRSKGVKPKGGLAEIRKTAGIFILYSAAPGTVSFDHLGPNDTDSNSVYTRTLLPLLNQPNLSIRDLAVKVRQRVYALTETEQIPEYMDGLVNDFCLSGCAPDSPKGPRKRSQLDPLIIGKDQRPMVLIPAGEFTMGSGEDDKSAGNDERPAHQVDLDDFYIDQYEVTTSHYENFLQETQYAVPKYWSPQVPKQQGNKPVVGVNWKDATTYCSWAGKRLPTEAEWEKAARRTDQRIYPWGNALPTDKLAKLDRCCNFNDYGALSDVGSYKEGMGPYGTYDMAGNVWEWVADWYDEAYYSKSAGRNPKGPDEGVLRVIRGGGWDSKPAMVRSAFRDRLSPSNRNAVQDGNIGFRCAQSVLQ